MQEQEVSAAKISKEGIRRLLSLLTFFENRDGTDYGSAATVTRDESGASNLHSATLTERASEFVTACYEEHFVQPFDWGEWSGRDDCDLTSPEFIARADLVGIIKMLTTHIRVDRFCDGHLLSAMENGTILRILERLRNILSEQDTGVSGTDRSTNT